MKFTDIVINIVLIEILVAVGVLIIGLAKLLLFL